MHAGPKTLLLLMVLGTLTFGCGAPNPAARTGTVPFAASPNAPVIEQFCEGWNGGSAFVRLDGRARELGEQGFQVVAIQLLPAIGSSTARAYACFARQLPDGD